MHRLKSNFFYSILYIFVSLSINFISNWRLIILIKSNMNKIYIEY